MDLERASALDRDAFAERFGGVFEESPWIARAAWPTRPWGTVAELHAAMVAVVDAAPQAAQLALLRAHPDLSGAARRARVTTASAQEQAAAGLDDLDPAREDELARRTRDYRERFGFPFVACAREHTPASLLAWVGERLEHDPAAERRTALGEVCKIARLRLDDLVTT